MRRRITLLLLLLISFSSFSQQDSIEVFLIESFITPEEPHTFKISFFTSESAKSSVIIDNTYDYIISEEFTDQHQSEIIIDDLRFSKKIVPFLIIVEDSLGNRNYSEQYEFDMPYDTQVEGGSNLFTLCLFGGTIFLLPSPAFVHTEGRNYFSLTKEIPLIFFRSRGIGYPIGYFAAEYSHIFNAPIKNFLKIGYKQFIEVPGIEYIAPGLNGFTDFRGFNGVSPEISLGLVKIYNVFTVYTRYRYNFKPGDTANRFHEVSLGLYSGFFAIYL